MRTFVILTHRVVFRSFMSYCWGPPAQILYINICVELVFTFNNLKPLELWPVMHVIMLLFEDLLVKLQGPVDFNMD